MLIVDNTSLQIISITLHVIAFVIWIGGMFLAHMALRPVVASLLEPPLRLSLMSQVLSRFFPWVWLSVILLWATGFWLIFGKFGGMANVGISIHIMLTIAAVMTIIYIYIFFVPFPALKQNVADKNFPEAGKSLATIRPLIGINLWLGLIVIIIGTAGRYILG
jgi:uncharacterized membrane protein